jgi:hypothetical protein
MLSRRQAAEVPSVNKQNDQHGSESAFAQERTADAALGALSGAVVLGPLGAVAGAVVGYREQTERSTWLGDDARVSSPDLVQRG